MDILSLVKDFGIPLSILIAAVVALWRAWKIERRLRDTEKKDRREKLEAREKELIDLYREAAKPALQRLLELADQQDVPELNCNKKGSRGKKKK